MIDEQTQDLVLQYLLGELDASQTERVRAQIESDQELRNFAIEMEETLASLAYAAKPVAAPPDIPQRILRAEGRSVQPTPKTSRSKVVAANLLPWALAACLAIACVILGLDRESERNGFSRQLAALRATHAETALALAQLQQRSTELEKQLQVLQEKDAEAQTELATLKQKAAQDEQAVAALTQKDADSQKELAALRQKNLLSEVKIATLKAQVAKFQQANAVVVWDPYQRNGVLQLEKLPPPAPGKDYQLWVIDPSNPLPVSAGVLSVPSAGLIRTSFHPAQPVQSASAFAISLEKSGGSMKPEGQIIFIGK